MKFRILVVDDDAVVRRSISTALTRAGYQVTTADEAVPAMELTERFDAVIVDYNMGTASGADVVKHFKARDGAVFCVVLSGDDLEEVNDRCRAVGAEVDAVLMKPALPSDLRRCLSLGLTAAA